MIINMQVNEQIPLSYTEELIYTNPTPNATTGNVEITVDWKKYKFFSVIVKYDTSSTATQDNYVFQSGINTYIMPNKITDYNYRASRVIRFTDNKITIYRNGSYGSLAEGNYYIPVRVYGYK